MPWSPLAAATESSTWSPLAAATESSTGSTLASLSKGLFYFISFSRTRGIFYLSYFFSTVGIFSFSRTSISLYFSAFSRSYWIDFCRRGFFLNSEALALGAYFQEAKRYSVAYSKCFFLESLNSRKSFPSKERKESIPIGFSFSTNCPSNNWLGFYFSNFCSPWNSFIDWSPGWSFRNYFCSRSSCFYYFIPSNKGFSLRNSFSPNFVSPTGFSFRNSFSITQGLKFCWCVFRVSTSAPTESTSFSIGTTSFRVGTPFEARTEFEAPTEFEALPPEFEALLPESTFSVASLLGTLTALTALEEDSTWGTLAAPYSPLATFALASLVTFGGTYLSAFESPTESTVGTTFASGTTWAPTESTPLGTPLASGTT